MHIQVIDQAMPTAEIAQSCITPADPVHLSARLEWHMNLGLTVYMSHLGM